MALKKKTTEEIIEEAEFFAAKLKFLKEIYPDIKVHDVYRGLINMNCTFSSAQVNGNYDGLEFLHGWQKSTLRVAPFSIKTFEHNGKIEDVKIHSNPRSSRLAYIDYAKRLKTPVATNNSQPNITIGTPPFSSTRFWSNYESYKVLRFGRVKINFKTHNFNEKMIEDCQKQIMEFISFHNGIEIDTKHLDTRLKKLLVML